MRPASGLAAGGLALPGVSGRGEPTSAGKRLGRQSGVPDLFTMRGAVAQGNLALSDLHGGPADGEPGAEAKEGGGRWTYRRRRPNFDC